MPTNPLHKGALASADAPRSEMLRRLERREISLGQYLDYCAEQAVSHLKSLMDSERLQLIQSMIRDQMTTDPVIVRYIEQATGLNPEVHKAS